MGVGEVVMCECVGMVVLREDVGGGLRVVYDGVKIGAVRDRGEN